MESRKYSTDQISQAKQMAEALANVQSGKRDLFSLVMESVMIGAEIATKHQQG